MATTKKLMGTTAAAGGAGFTAIEDVFSTYLYTGNGSTQTITNGIDLAGEGGLVWIKRRTTLNGFNASHFLNDTERGVENSLATDTTSAGVSTSGGLQQFLSDGFEIGSTSSQWNASSASNQTYASWTFRKAPRFFDVVTYTGDGTGPRSISHNLGSVPGCIIVKRTDSTSDWIVYHRGVDSVEPQDYGLFLNATNARNDTNDYWDDTAPTESSFTTSWTVNASGATYVAYLFAHDPLGPSGDGSDGLIACGSLTLTSGNVTSVDLGWEPQWLLVKKSSAGQNWQLFDNMRGFLYGFDGTNSRVLSPNTSAVESNLQASPLSDGFALDANNWGAGDYIYIAIRRGPMRQPTSGTEVFDTVLRSGTSSTATVSTVLTDLVISHHRNSGIEPVFYDRMRGATKALQSNQNGSESTYSDGLTGFDLNDGYKLGADQTGAQINFSGVTYANWVFRRAPGFFDVVCYTGNGTAGRTVPHNLGVAPEMMIVKARSETRDWSVYHAGMGNTHFAKLNTTDAAIDYLLAWNDTTPDETFFTLGSGPFANGNNQNFIAYLFATVPGVSKVGSFSITQSGGDVTVDCGFTSGARFVLLKSANTSSNWYVFDTERGIVAGTFPSGTDPYLTLNTTGAENNSFDAISPTSSGFIARVGNDQLVPGLIPDNSTIIYLAIA